MPPPPRGPHALPHHESAEHAGLIEARHGELRRVELRVAHGLVVGEVEPSRVLGFFHPSNELQRDADHPRVARELLPYPEGQHDQSAPAGPLGDEPHRLNLDQRLAQPEAGEDRPASPPHRPTHDVALVRLEDRVNLLGRNLVALAHRVDDLGLEEGAIRIGRCCGVALLPYRTAPHAGLSTDSRISFRFS